MNEKLQRLYDKLWKMGAGGFDVCDKAERAQYENLKTSELPENIIKLTNEQDKTYYVKVTDMDELQVEIALFNAKNIKSIKTCVVFFAALAIIGIVLSIIIPTL